MGRYETLWKTLKQHSKENRLKALNEENLNEAYSQKLKDKSHKVDYNKKSKPIIQDIQYDRTRGSEGDDSDMQTRVSNLREKSDHKNYSRHFKGSDSPFGHSEDFLQKRQEKKSIDRHSGNKSSYTTVLFRTIDKEIKKADKKVEEAGMEPGNPTFDFREDELEVMMRYGLFKGDYSAWMYIRNKKGEAYSKVRFEREYPDSGRVREFYNMEIEDTQNYGETDDPKQVAEDFLDYFNKNFESYVDTAIEKLKVAGDKKKTKSKATKEKVNEDWDDDSDDWEEENPTIWDDDGVQLVISEFEPTLNKVVPKEWEVPNRLDWDEDDEVIYCEFGLKSDRGDLVWAKADIYADFGFGIAGEEVCSGDTAEEFIKKLSKSSSKIKEILEERYSK